MQDEYKTLVGDAEGLFKAKGSKFIAYAQHVLSEEDVSTFVKTIQEKHFKARHHCYAYRIGLTGNRWRANDDGEPSNSAGKPILGQIDSFELTDVAIVVVRYFGGTKLGVSGLIEAYRESAADALRQANIETRIAQTRIRIQTDYAHLADLMNAIKAGSWEIVKQEMTEQVRVILSYRQSEFKDAFLKLWLVLAKAYPGEEDLSKDPAGYQIEVV